MIHRAVADHGEPIKVTIDELAEYCKEGREYSAIEVWDDVPLLGEDGVLMDTPASTRPTTGIGWPPIPHCIWRTSCFTSWITIMCSRRAI